MNLKNQFENTNWSSRKLIVCFTIQVLSTIFLFMDLFDAQNWIDVTKWNVMVYGITNAGSKLTGSIGNK